MKKIFFIISLIIVAIIISIVIISTKYNKNNNQNTVYNDMKQLFDEANLLSSNIGIFTKLDENGTISYGECGSGVIFKNENGFYYALTAAHVISTENAKILVFTTNTEMKNESVPGFDNVNVLSEEVYDKMYSAEIVYISQRDDLAIIQFKSDENLSIVKLSNSNPKIDDRIMCIGNPENNWFSISYGKVTSEIKKFGEYKGYPTYAMEHTAYIQVGSSGGAALNDKMELVGITPGASLSLNGKKFNYGVLIPTSEIKLCIDEWEKNN